MGIFFESYVSLCTRLRAVYTITFQEAPQRRFFLISHCFSQRVKVKHWPEWPLSSNMTTFLPSPAKNTKKKTTSPEVLLFWAVRREKAWRVFLEKMSSSQHHVHNYSKKFFLQRYHFEKPFLTAKLLPVFLTLVVVFFHVMSIFWLRVSQKAVRELRMVSKIPFLIQWLISFGHCFSISTINPLRANYSHTWHMENHPFLWRRIRRIRRIQVCMACKGLILKTRQQFTKRTFDLLWCCPEPLLSITLSLHRRLGPMSSNRIPLQAHAHCHALARGERSMPTTWSRSDTGLPAQRSGKRLCAEHHRSKLHTERILVGNLPRLCPVSVHDSRRWCEFQHYLEQMALWGAPG